MKKKSGKLLGKVSSKKKRGGTRIKTSKKKAKRTTRRKVRHFKPKTKQRAKRGQKKGKITTGLSKLDRLIGGGFPADSVNLIVGGAGSGKTILATQFLIEGAKKGESGIFVTFEEKKERFYEDMKELGWELNELEKKKKIAFIEYTPEQVKKMLDEGGGEIEVVIESIKAKRMVMDSITSFALLFETELAKREAALSLFELLRKWNVTTLLTLEQEPTIGMNADHIASPLEFEVDGIILLYFISKKGARVRALEVLKMRGTDHSNKIYKFDVKKGGIAINGEWKLNGK